MTSKRRILPLIVVLLVWENLNSIDASPESLSPSQATSELLTSLPMKNMENPSPSVAADESSARKKAITTGSREKTRLREPPGSPVKLFMPDEFQFYTLNNYGQLVMKQMTKQEIQGMIAASVGDGGLDVADSLKEPGKHQTQLINDAPKVSDVVQNVQKVLKGELNKPVQVHPSSSSIPGSVNSQWTNMLPYILSGGSVDQQDVVQDTSIILPTLDVDQTYIDVVPLQNSKPTNDHYDTGSNHVQLQSTSHEQEIKLVTPHKQTLSTSEKPIYLLGNMALDSDILEEQETYTLPTKDKPHRPALTSMYQKFTTMKPFATKDSLPNYKNSTNGKPTLYIPVSISSSHKTNLQNKNNYDQPDIYKISENILKPNHDKYGITLSTREANSTTIGISSKKTTPNTYSNDYGFTKVPMNKVPIASAEKISSSTQRINEQKIPFYDALPTIFPTSVSVTTAKENLYTTRTNVVSIGGFKKPTTYNRPSTSYHPVYETATKPSTYGFTSTSSYYPETGTSIKSSVLNKESSTYRPIYESISKISTGKPLLLIHQPVQESITKPNIVSTASSATSNLINELENKSSIIGHKPDFSQYLYQTSTTNGLKTSQYFNNTYQPHSTDKNSSAEIQAVIKTNIQNVELKETQEPITIQDTNINSENKDSSLTYTVEQLPEQILPKNTENITINLLKTSLYNNSEINQIIESTTSYFINDKNYNTDAYTDITNKLIEKTTENSEWNKVYGTDMGNGNIYTTTVPINTETNSKIYSINQPNQTKVVNTAISGQDQLMKTEEFNIPEESSTNTELKIQIQEFKIGNNNDYYTATVNGTTKQPEIIYNQTDSTPIEITETTVANYNTYSINNLNIAESNNLNQSLSSITTDKPEKIDNNSHIKIILTNKTDEFLNGIKESNIIDSAHVNKYEKIPSWTKSELTTEFIPIQEGTTDYNTIIYNFDEVKNPISSTYEEPSINIQESTVIPYKVNISDQSDVESTVEYSTLVNKIIDSKESSNKNKIIKPIDISHDSNVKDIDKTKIYGDPVVQNDLNKPVYDKIQVKVPNNTVYKYSTNDFNNKISTPAFINSYEIKSENYDKLTIENFVNSNKNKDAETKIYLTTPSYQGTDSALNYNKNSYVLKSENKTLPLNLNTSVEPIDSSNKKSSVDQEYSSILPNFTGVENNFNQYDLFNIGNTTPANADKELITNEFSVTPKENDKYTTDIITDNDKIKISLQEVEVSTIKVIPVYDDDTSMYTLLSSNPSQIPLKIASNIKLTENSFNTTKSTDSSSYKINQVFKPINQQEYKTIYQTVTSSATIIPPMKNYITQNIPTYNTILPSLHETFDDYLKKNYNTKTTTENYNEVPHLTTFSTEDHLSTLKTLNQIPINTSNQQKLQLNMGLTDIPKNNGTEAIKDYFSTPTYILENVDSFKTEKNLESVTKNTNIKEIYSTEYLDDNYSTYTTKYPEIKNINNAETPIIYLDLVNRDSNKKNSSYQLNNYNTNSSLFTRIKIKNPVLEIEKLISEAPASVNSPPLVHYNLPNYYMVPNTIASGLIAGYPTYEQVKPTTEYITDSTTYDSISGISNMSTNQDSVYYTLNNNSENISQKDKNFSYQEKSTTLIVENDRNYMDKTSSIPIYVAAGEETTTYSNQPFEETNYESYTIIPHESLPMSSKTEIPSQAGEKYDSSLKKISDLMNEVKNKSSEHNSTTYELSIDVTTDIIPMERLETVTDNNNFTPNGDTLTTIFDNTIKISAESKNNTYTETQTSYTKSYQNTTETTGHYITTRTQNTEDMTTYSILKVKSSSGTTTPLTIMKQSTTGKPFLTSTYSTTKGLLEKTQSMIDKSAGRINLEEEKNKIQKVKPTEPTKFTMKNKIYYSTDKRPTSEGHQSYTRKITRPINKGTTLFTKEFTTSRPITVTKESNTDKWTQIPQKNIADQTAEMKQPSAISKEAPQSNPQIVALDHATGAIGLDQSNKGLDKDVAEFLNICNELSFKFWTLANSELSSSRSVTLSPFGMISTLAMIFLGARGLTSNQMNDILKLDDVVTFNPHLVFQNITDTVTLARGQGIQNAAFVRALFADRLKVRKIMPFYKEQAQQFYEGAVVDINFSTAGDILRRRTNLLIRKQTGGRIKDFVKTHTVPLRSPLTALSANIFQTSCDSPDASTEGRDGEMYFAVSQTVKQRKLVPIPAVVWKSGVSAGYEPSLDATAVALGDTKRPVSLIMVMPGQQGLTAAGDNLERLEHRLFGNPSDNALEKLLKVIVPRRVEIQMPKFSHRSIVNITSALKKLGFDQLFAKTADLKGINGAGHDLYLADMLQMNLFYTCNDENKLGGRPLSETFPGTSSRHTRAWETINNSKTGIDDYLENNESDDTKFKTSSKHDNEEDCEDSLSLDDSSNSNEGVEVLQSQLPQLGKGNNDGIYNLRQKLHKKRLWWFTPMKHRRCRNRRQAEIEKPRMKMDKPFLYLIRHNLTGLILHIGRFNPKNQS